MVGQAWLWSELLIMQVYFGHSSSNPNWLWDSWDLHYACCWESLVAPFAATSPALSGPPACCVRCRSSDACMCLVYVKASYYVLLDHHHRSPSKCLLMQTVRQQGGVYPAVAAAGATRL